VRRASWHELNDYVSRADFCAPILHLETNIRSTKQHSHSDHMGPKNQANYSRLTALGRALLLRDTTPIFVAFFCRTSSPQHGVVLSCSVRFHGCRSGFQVILVSHGSACNTTKRFEQNDG
jgi:hypothetical protein